MPKKYSAYKNRNCIFAIRKNWRVVRVVEGARLESVYTGNCIASSNLAVSAPERRFSPLLKRFFDLSTRITISIMHLFGNKLWERILEWRMEINRINIYTPFLVEENIGCCTGVCTRVLIFHVNCYPYFQKQCWIRPTGWSYFRTTYCDGYFDRNALPQNWKALHALHRL